MDVTSTTPRARSGSARITGTLTGSRTASACGITVTVRDPERTLCRTLVAAGYSGPLLLRDGTTGRPRVLIRDIERAARWTVVEGDHDGLRLVPYRPLPVDLPRAPARVPPISAGRGGGGPTLPADTQTPPHAIRRDRTQPAVPTTARAPGEIQFRSMT